MRKNSLIRVKIKPDTWKWYWKKYRETWDLKCYMQALEIRGRAMFMKNNIGLVFSVIREDKEYYYVGSVNGCEFNTIRKELVERVSNT